jgi:hypothetical protein
VAGARGWERRATERQAIAAAVEASTGVAERGQKNWRVRFVAPINFECTYRRRRRRREN